MNCFSLPAASRPHVGRSGKHRLRLEADALFEPGHKPPFSTHYIAPDKLMQNGFIESFDSSLRSELLNETRSPRQPRRVATPATLDFNTAQPHSQTAWQTPDEFASTFTPQQSLALHYAKGSGPALVASPAQQGTTNAGNEL